MALLQISEPGQSPEPHRHRLAGGHRPRHHQFAGGRGGNGIAVVLTTMTATRCCVDRALSARWRGRVGREAEAEQARDPRNTIVSVKRFMGRA